MLILASASATRKALLAKAGLRFEVLAASLDERALENAVLEAGGDGRDVALVLAQAKAKAISLLRPGALVIGADQTLALGRELLHKPQSLAAAASHLDRLRVMSHSLHAALALMRDGELLWSDIETAELTMRAFSDAERDRVLALEGQDILLSVGGYRLEGPSIRLFEAVSGDYFTILGLPLLALLAALRDIAPDLLQSQD